MSTVVESVPPLCAFDRLTAEEFLRRWENEPSVKRAELIGGVVHMPSPVSVEHGEMEGLVGGWLICYQAQTPGVVMAHNATTFLLDDVPQLDVHLRILPEFGGRSWVEGKYLHGSPELIVEICQTSAAYDLNEKLSLYRDAGVAEYLAVVLHEEEIRWHRLVGGAYEPLAPDADGILRSRTFPGLWLDGRALFAKQADRTLATLQSGLASSEHRAFVETLAARHSATA